MIIIIIISSSVIRLGIPSPPIKPPIKNMRDRILTIYPIIPDAIITVPIIIRDLPETWNQTPNMATFPAAEIANEHLISMLPSLTRIAKIVGVTYIIFIIQLLISIDLPLTNLHDLHFIPIINFSYPHKRAFAQRTQIGDFGPIRNTLKAKVMVAVK